MDNWLILAAVLAIVLVSGLSFYAGRLLFLLKQQNDKATAVRHKRIGDITESIQIIAKAVEQQQCNLSEASIRIVNLLQAIPVKSPEDYSERFPSTFDLYGQVKDLPTHDARKALSRQERDAQDERREEAESQLESSILKEMLELRAFSVSI